MTFFHFLIFLILAGITGGIAQALAGYSHGGCLVSIALGFVGALLGTWIATALGLPALLVIEVGSQPFPIVWAILGATLFVGVLSVPSRSRI